MSALRKYVILAVNAMLILLIIVLVISLGPADDLLGLFVMMIVGVMIIFDAYALIVYSLLRAYTKIWHDALFFILLFGPPLYIALSCCR